jgi:hypothetical protein
MSRNIKLLAGMNVLAWIVIVPVLAIALVNSPVRLADHQGRPQDRLDDGIVALGHPPTRAPARTASPGARVGLNALEGVTGRVQTMRTSYSRSAAAGHGSSRVSQNLTDREPSGVRRSNGTVDLRGEIGDDQAGGRAPVGRVRPNTGAAPAPGVAPTPDGNAPQSDQPPPQSESPHNGTQPDEQPPPISARPKSPEPDPPADPPQSPPDEPGTTPPPDTPAPPVQPPADEPPPSNTEPPPAEDPPGTMGGPSEHDDGHR